jgi:hypothetical protein
MERQEELQVGDVVKFLHPGDTYSWGQIIDLSSQHYAVVQVNSGGVDVNTLQKLVGYPDSEFCNNIRELISSGVIVDKHKYAILIKTSLVKAPEVEYHEYLIKKEIKNQ